MLGELWWSRRNERRLLQRGAIEAPDRVYPTMRWAYPGVFVLMAMEGVVRGAPPVPVAVIGAALFVAAKALKYWAIASLGTFWTYRVLVVPGARLVTSGPYRFVRHPNYVAVIGELLGMMLMTGAWLTGPPGTLFFGSLLWRRIRDEETALGRMS